MATNGKNKKHRVPRAAAVPQSSRPGATKSPDEPPVIEPALPTRLTPLALWECVPEAEGLVPGTCDNRLAIRAHRKVENAACMAGKRRDYVQRWILPYADLVLGCSRGKTMCRDDLMRSERPSKVADLCICTQWSSHFSSFPYARP
jgi:hypothetical protein